MFRKSIVAIAVLLMVPAFALAQAKVDTAAIAKQLEANERAINVAVQKGDVKGFQALVAPEGISVDGTGAMPVADFVKEFAQIKLQTFTIDMVKVSMLGDNAAVITYKFTGKGSFMGQPMPSPVTASTVYMNRGGKWIAVFHQESPFIAPPPPAKK